MATQAHNAWLERVFGITLPQSVKNAGSAVADGADQMASKASGKAAGVVGFGQGFGGTVADQIEQMSDVPVPLDPISTSKQVGQVINYVTDKDAPLDSIAAIGSLEKGANLAKDVVHYEMADPAEQLRINERVGERIVDKVKETGQEIAQAYDDAEAQGPDGENRFAGMVTGKIAATVALGFLGGAAPEAEAATDVIEGAGSATEEGAENLADDALHDPVTTDDADPDDDGSGDDDQSGDDTLVDQKAVDDPLIDQDPVTTDDADPDDDGSGDDDQSGDGEQSGDDESGDGDEDGEDEESEDHDEHAGHVAAHGLGEAAAHVVVEQVKDVVGAAVGDDDSGDDQDDAGDDGDDDDNDNDDADDAKKTP